MEEKIKILKITEIPFGRVELRADNILVFRPDVGRFKQYDLPVLEVLLDTFKEITNGTPRPYMCDNRYITGIVNRGEQTFINEHFGAFATKAAMITTSPVIKIIVNSYNAIFKPKVEVKLFGSEKKAVDWLLKE